MRCVRNAAVLSVFLTAPVWGQTAGMLSFQGLIKDAAGNPITGTVDLEFRIFDAETLGNLVDMNGDGVVDDIIGLDAKQILAQPVSAGVLSTKFGPVSAMAFDGTPRWLEVRVDGSPLSRIEMATAPATSEQVNIPPTGTPAISVDGAGNVGIGTKTPGAKLHVTGTPGADGIMFPDGKLQTTALPSPCAPEQVIKWDATTNMWICSNDIDTDTLGAIMCPLNNQIIKWNAAAGTWVCANDLDTDTDTQNTLDQAYNEGGPGAGRAITANSGAVSITVPFIGPGFGNDALTAVNNAGVGGGGAAVFQITNATNNSAALLAATNSISGQPAILGRATGNTNSAAITGQNFSAGLLAIGVEGTVVGNPMVANVGVRGSTASTGDGTTGVLGEATGTTGTIFGVQGTTPSTSDGAAGVMGEASGTTGTIFGVQGTTPSTSDGAAGVMGEATGTTGRIFGVQGATRSAADGAAGVMGLASGATGGIFGVHGISSSTSRWTAGVKGSVGSAGLVNQNIEVATMGVHGITAFNTTKTVGVEGDATTGAPPRPIDTTIGVRGFATSITDPSAIVVGVEGDANKGVPDVMSIGFRVPKPLVASGVRGWNQASMSGADNGRAGVVGQIREDVGPNPEPSKPAGHNGVWGVTQSGKANSAGVLGETTDENGGVYGVHGRTQKPSNNISAAGVRGTGNGCSGAGAVNIHDGALTVTGPAKTADTVPLTPPATPIYSCSEIVPISCTSSLAIPQPTCTDPVNGLPIPCKGIAKLEGACEDPVSGVTTHDCIIDPAQVIKNINCVADPHCHIIGFRDEFTVLNCLVRSDSIILLTIASPSPDDIWSYTAQVTIKTPPVAGGGASFTVRYTAIGNGSFCDPAGACLLPTTPINLSYLIINPVP